MVTMKRYKVIYGFDTEEYIPIGEHELEKAIYAAMIQGRVAFDEGFIDGKLIQKIVPDYHAVMGWARGHELGSDDYNELADKGIDRQHKLFQAKAKQRVEYLVSNNQRELVGTGVEIPELESATKDHRGGSMKAIGNFLQK